MHKISAQLVCRTATSADAKNVAQILISSRKAFLPYAPSPHTDAEIRSWVETCLLVDCDVTVAVVDNISVGVLAVSVEDGISWIEQLYIDPQYVNRGLGTLLLDELFSRQQATFRLYCFQRNSRARALYERYGFKAIGYSDGANNEEQCPDVLYQRISSK
ncbi:MAG: hypothetical protein OFPI_35910 [Osedax symbiont Rs2]|nr:MAG: hypothetical protein OFPI_35910 [Osedax symbiont Rs2]